MAVAANRSGNTATITVTLDVTDILAAAGVSNAEKRVMAFSRAIAEMQSSIEAIQNSDTQLDAQVTDIASRVATVKAARPTGNL